MTIQSIGVTLAVCIVSFLAISLIFLLSVTSIFTVLALRSVFAFIVRVIQVGGEIVVAVVAALCSGATLTLTVVLSACAASMTFPASSIEARIGVSVAISASAVVVSASAIMFLASLKIDLEVLATVVGATSLSVAFAAAWAVGVMSLIEKETQQVGLKMTSVLDAVRNNNHRILRLLVKLHTGLKQRDMDLALLHAVKAGFPECAKVLLSAKANVNARDTYDNTPLLLACECGSSQLVEILLLAGASVDLRNNSRGTALHVASKWGHDDCVRLLILYNADVNMQDGMWRTPLFCAAKYAHHPENVMQMLINAGCDVNTVGCEQRTALHHAASRGLNINMLLSAGAQHSVQDAQGNTPLHCAAADGHVRVIQALVGMGSDPNIRNYQRRNSLHFAAQSGSVECLKVLVKAGGNIGLPDLAGNTPLWYASYYNNLEAAIFCLACNCPVRSFHNQHGGMTFISNPLVAALEKLHLSVARVLVIGGCNCKDLHDWLLDIPPGAWTEENAEYAEWLKECVQNPWTLSHLTRVVIRNVLTTNLILRVHELPLPKSLKDFVLFKDLNDMQRSLGLQHPAYTLRENIYLCL